MTYSPTYSPICIITRPQADSMPLIPLVQDYGYRPIYAPLMEIDWFDRALPDADFQAIIITSANSVRALCRDRHISRFFDIPIIAVGESSADIARGFGFKHIFHAQGHLESLVERVGGLCHRDNGSLLYPSGTTVSRDLKSLLQAEGFDVFHLPLYRARGVKGLSQSVQDAITGNYETTGGGCVLLFSPRTARLWIERLCDGDIFLPARHLIHYVLADSVRDIILHHFPSPPPKIEVSAFPHRDSLLSLLRNTQSYI